jgi:hypothetical protein
VEDRVTDDRGALRLAAARDPEGNLWSFGVNRP